MQLSEAIRLGAMLKPQARKVLLSAHGGTCALGAAFDAIGILDRLVMPEVPDMWAWCRQTSIQCPACRKRHIDCVFCLIAHINDCHHWTRERIADWVATVEPAPAASVTADTQLVTCG